MPIILNEPLAGRTFLQLQDEALGDDFNATKYRERVKVWINTGLSRIARRSDIPELQVDDVIYVNPGTSIYTLPPDLVRIISLRDTSLSEEVIAIPIREMDEGEETAGYPYTFAVFGRNVHLYPIPSTATTLTVRYVSDATQLTSDSDVPLVPDDYADLLVTFARYRLFRAEDDAEMANFYYSEFERDLLTLKADLQFLDSSQTRQIPSMWD